MHISIDLREKFGRPASIILEERMSDALPEVQRRQLEEDLRALLGVLGGFAVAVIEERLARSGVTRPADLMEELMATLAHLAAKRIEGR